MDDATAAEPRPVPRMLGHYEVLEQIGQGGMAVVYKGVQPSLNRPVAIKVLPQRFAKSEELLARFDREANVAAQLNHPNIVQVIDRGKEGDALFIVMEYVEGESLDKLIRKKALTLPEILDYSMQICDGLDFAHSKGVVHRDLKPSNILIDVANGRAKIADFGIAQFETTGSGLSTLTQQGAALGTMNYMSPEQRLDSSKVTHHTDIFSFGVVLYEMLTGKLPIGHFKLPSLINPHVPIGFDHVVARCLAESPADRYQSAAEIKEDLGRITSRQLRRRKPGHAPAQPRRALLVVGGIAVGVLVVVGGVAALSGRRSAEPDAQPVPPTRPATTAPPTAYLPTVPYRPPGQTTAPAARPTELPPATPERAELPSVTPQQEALQVQVHADYVRAQGLLGSGRHRDALPLLRQIVRDHPGHPLAPQAQLAIAQAYEDLGDYERASEELAQVPRLFPGTPQATEARFGKIRLDWKTAPRHGLARNQYDADLQERLVRELQALVAATPDNRVASAEMRLIVEICTRPDLNDWRTAADTLLQLRGRDPSWGADDLFRAAEYYHKQLADVQKAVATYREFLKEFPDDPRGRVARDRLQLLGE